LVDKAKSSYKLSARFSVEVQFPGKQVRQPKGKEVRVQSERERKCVFRVGERDFHPFVLYIHLSSL